LIENFNLRYECNDARDDHYTQMKKKMSEAQFGFTSHFSNNRDKLVNEFSDNLDDPGDDDIKPDQWIGAKTQKLFQEMDEIRKVLRGAKWLSKIKDGLLKMQVTQLITAYKPQALWLGIVKEARKLITVNKLADIPNAETAEQVFYTRASTHPCR
jgi:hypothetical protein